MNLTELKNAWIGEKGTIDRFFLLWGYFSILVFTLLTIYTSPEFFQLKGINAPQVYMYLKINLQNFIG